MTCMHRQTNTMANIFCMHYTLLAVPSSFSCFVYILHHLLHMYSELITAQCAHYEALLYYETGSHIYEKMAD